LPLCLGQVKSFGGVLALNKQDQWDSINRNVESIDWQIQTNMVGYKVVKFFPRKSDL
jgi:hypothetical protein